MAGAGLEVVRLTRRFGGRTAVDDLSFAAQPGEVVGLLGPNGAGKTTTIRLLTTVLAPSGGTFSVAGVPFTRPTEIRRRVGVLPESAGYPEHQTGTGYLRYHARLFGLAHRDAAFVTARLLTEFGLADRASSRISTYSRGMRQRLGIARALVNDPAVVFLDEPTLGLDPAGQRQLLGIVREIALRRGALVVLSTHSLTDVEEICSSVLILDKGRVLVAGTVGEVTRATSQRYGQLRVPIELVDRSRRALADVAGLTFTATGDRPDVLRISVPEAPDGRRDRTEAGLNAGLRAVLDADVPILSYEVHGSRLSDAFLTMTGDGNR